MCLLGKCPNIMTESKGYCKELWSDLQKEVKKQCNKKISGECDIYIEICNDKFIYYFKLHYLLQNVIYCCKQDLNICIVFKYPMECLVGFILGFCCI